MMTSQHLAGLVAAVWRRWPWLLLLAFSMTLHLWGLGERSFHHDESIHAHSAYNLLHHGVYRYDPTYHGPLLYFLTAGSYVAIGDSDFAARLPIAAAGILLLGVAWALRRPFGERAAWWTGLLVTISPVCLFYGRFLRMDILEMLTASCAMVAFYRAARGSPRAWVWGGVWTGLAFATKENAYVTSALVAWVWGVMALGYALSRSWKVAYREDGPRRNPQALLKAGVSAAANGTVDVVAGLSSWLWRHRFGVLAAVAVAFMVTVPLYTAGFEHPEDWFFAGKAIKYWWGQHEEERVGGPPWYHLPRLAQYELLPIVAALIWCGRRWRRLRRVETALLLFGVSSIAMYCYLGEKVPWLGVHQVWAFLPLAGAQLARTFGPRGRWWSRSLAGAAVAGTAVAGICASFVTDEISPNLDRVESLVYVQTSPELAEVVAEGRRLAAEGAAPVAAVSSEAAWPLTWYWRGLDVWWSEPAAGIRPPLVVCDLTNEAAMQRLLGPGYEREVIPLRSWWVSDRWPSPSELLGYVFTRVPWSAIGSADVVVLRRRAEVPPSRREVEVPAVFAERLGVSRAWLIGERWLMQPRGLAVDNGVLAVADAGGSRVALFDGDGLPLEPGLTLALNEPEAVAWSRSGELVIADTWNHRTLLLDRGRSAVTMLPVPPSGWYGPRSIAVSVDGTIAVADTGNKRLVVYAPAGGRSETWGAAGSAQGQLDEPGGVAWIDAGRLLVCDTGNHRMQVFSRTGTIVSETALPGAWQDYYARPQVAVLASGMWLASDTSATSLWLILRGAAEQIDLGGTGIVPTGVAWAAPRLYLGDLQGRVWELEILPERLQRIAERSIE